MIPLPRITPTNTTTDMREEWQDDAACATTDPDLFFPEAGRPGTDAKKICATCPVKAECLDYAIRTHTTTGVWGGKAGLSLRRIVRRAS